MLDLFGKLKVKKQEQVQEARCTCGEVAMRLPGEKKKRSTYARSAINSSIMWNQPQAYLMLFPLIWVCSRGGNTNKINIFDKWWE